MYPQFSAIIAVPPAFDAFPNVAAVVAADRATSCLIRYVGPCLLYQWGQDLLRMQITGYTRYELFLHDQRCNAV